MSTNERQVVESRTRRSSRRREAIGPAGRVKPAAAKAAGRPAGERRGVVRGELIEAARVVVLERGSGGAGIREIARRAGVNPAMVHYYFGDRESLLLAMLDAAVEPLLNTVRDWSRSAPDGPPAIHGFISTVHAVIAERPWLPHLIVREILGHEGQLRERFIEHFASRGRGILVGLIRAEQAAGRLRRDLDAVALALSLISLTLFPFLALPVTERLYRFSIDNKTLAGQAEHTARVFLEGAGA